MLLRTQQPERDTEGVESGLGALLIFSRVEWTLIIHTEDARHRQKDTWTSSPRWFVGSIFSSSENDASRTANGNL